MKSFVDSNVARNGEPRKMKIYKYHSVNINLLQSLRKKINWYSKLHLLNDPFECFFHDKTQTDIYIQLISSLAVCCFSKNLSEILMWSHYASNHSGVCLEFEVTGEETIKGRLIDVEYVNDIITLETIQTTDTGHLRLNISSNGKFIKTKFKNWEYEQEVRTYVFCESEHRMGREMPFIGELTGIYFGKNASFDSIELIKHNTSHMNSLNYYQVNLNTSTMRMDSIKQI